MSKIIATDHFEFKNWEVNFENLAYNYADLFIGFTNKDSIVYFDDLKFKYELRQNNVVEQFGVYPPPGVKYLHSDQTYIVVERLDFQAETEYQLYLWAMNKNEIIETTITFITPRPEQPYKSWSWDGTKWNPPIECPSDDNFYLWNEENQSWVINTNI